MHLGKGSYGTVTKYKSRARKTFKQLKHLIQEYTALKYLENCHYVVHCMGVNFNKLYLDMELYDTSLKNYLDGNVKEEDKHTIIYQVLCGMIELQDLHLSHSDIKPGNILIQKNPLKAVLGDCGFVSLHKYAKQQRTAPAYRDIDIVNDDKHDIYSFAIMYMEIIFRIEPNNYYHYKQLYNTIDQYVPKNQQQFMKKLVCHDRSKRPDARAIMSKLYTQTPIFNSPKKYKNKYHNQLLYNLMNIHSKKLSIRRCTSGYYALLYYFNHYHIDEQLYPNYIAAMLIILASMFGNKAERIDYIMRYCFPNTTHNTDKIITLVGKLTKNTTVLQILFN